MTNNPISPLSDFDKQILLEIIREQLYPKSAKELRSLIRKHGLQFPEYLITRALKELISEDKVRFKGGRWMSPELHSQIGTPQSGYSPKTIEAPSLSPEGQKVSIPGKVAVSKIDDDDIPEDRGPWVTFRRLLRYYQECVRDEGGADASSFLNQIGKQFVFVNGTGNWFPQTGKKWNYILPLGEHIADFQQQLSRNREDNVVVLGYPLEAFRNTSPEGEYTLIRPIFYYLLDVKFTDGSISFSTSDAQPEISPEWLKHALKSYSEQYHFLSACGLLNQPRPLDEPQGFTSEDIRPDLDDLARTLAGFMPRRIKEQLSPRTVLAHTLPGGLKSGIYNRAVIMAGSRTQFTQTLLKELRHIEKQPDGILDQTSLRFLFKDLRNSPEQEIKGELTHEECVADLLPLNSEQREATASLLNNNISVVTGPPGTGKSQVAVSAASNARLFGQTVLFTSRNHKAIDAVYERAHDRNDQPFITRANSKSDPNLKYSFSHAIGDLLSNTINVEDVSKFDRRVGQLKSRLSQRGETARLADEIQKLRDQAGSIEEELAWLSESLDNALISRLKESGQHVSANQLDRLSTLLIGIIQKGDNLTDYPFYTWVIQWVKMIPLWRTLRQQINVLPGTTKLSVLPPIRRERFQRIDISLYQKAIQYISLLKRLTPIEKALEERPLLGTFVSDLSQQNDKILELSDELISRHMQITGGLPANSDKRESIAALRVALRTLNRGFESEKEQKKVLKELQRYTPLVTENFPCWAVTNLSVGSKIPLTPSCFDLALIDEASQCDIASAIPILYRSRRAGVVGDPHQLKHVNNLTIGKDSLFRKKAGLSELNDKRYSYRETSLYDLFAQTNAVSPHMLKETFRSCTGIADYSNNAFYGGQLRVATDESKLKTPKGTKTGIHWTIVEGDVRSAGRSGCVCDEEIEAVYGLVKDLLVENNFKGSIGVVTPFRIQANRLNDKIFEGDIPYTLLTGAQVVVDTSHGFQGDEKDVMIFSLCGGPNMPQGSKNFLRESANLFNVAVSRARAVLHVVGNQQWAASSAIPHVASLASPPEAKPTAPNNSPWAPYESPWEKNLAEALGMKGINVIPQYPVAGRRLDLALVDKSRGVYIDLEVDGDLYHRNPDGSRKKDDLWRDITIQGRGWHVMRFWVYRLKEHMDECVEEIEAAWR